MFNMQITDGKKTYSVNLDQYGVLDTVYCKCRFLTSKNPVVKKLVSHCDKNGQLTYTNLPTGFKAA